MHIDERCISAVSRVGQWRYRQSHKVNDGVGGLNHHVENLDHPVLPSPDLFHHCGIRKHADLHARA